MLRAYLEEGGQGVDAQGSAAAAATQADRTADLATKVTAIIRELSEARNKYFAEEEAQLGVQVRTEGGQGGLEEQGRLFRRVFFVPQERLRADIEMLRAEEAVLTRRVRRMLGRTSN